ncbi:MAG: hypothetical protein WAU78_12810 [Roseiarcus sp.]
MNFSEIDAARQRAGLSVLELSRRARAAPSTFWFIRTARVKPRRSTLDRYAAALSGLAIPAPRRGNDAERRALIAGAYRGALTLLATRLGLDPIDVAADAHARAFWRVRALALWVSSIEFDINAATVARALGISKQLAHWNIRKANAMLDDPKLAAIVEEVGRMIAGRRDEDPFLHEATAPRGALEAAE